MAVVHFVRKVPAADGVLVPARGGLRFTPTARRVIVGAPDVVVLPASFSVQLVNGAADVTLEPTTGAWVWRVDEYCTGVDARAAHVAVPAVAELDDTDLVIVDPATLTPAAVDNLAWVQTIGAVFVVSDTEPTETTRHGVPVVWIDTSDTTAPVADTTAPSAVTGFTAGTATTTTVPLSWTAATDNTAVTGYEYSLNGTTWTATGSTGTTYTVTGLTAGTAYTIQVRAYDAAGNKGAAASVNATTTAATDTTAPTAPTNLAGTAGTTTMDLSWTASTDAVGVTGYRVSKDNGATWITSAVTGTTYQVTGLTASTSYTFAVAARDAAGNWSTNATLVKSTTAAAQNYEQTVAGFTPTYFYPLEDPAGTTNPEQIGSGSITTTVAGTATFGAASIGPGAASLYAPNTSGNAVSLPTTGVFDGATSMAFMAVIRPEALPGSTAGVFGKNLGAKLTFNASGRMSVSLNGTTAITSNTTHPVAAGTSYHIGVTYDGTTLKLFRNGVLAQSVTGSGAVATSAYNTYIGGVSSSSGLGGWIYGAALWRNAALTDAQMLQAAQAAGLA